MARRKISEDRQMAYYVGMGLTGLGVLLFLSVFVSGCMNFGDFSNFQGQAKSSMGRAIVGIIFIVVGQGIMSVGRSGLAGSGVKLDPEEAREDLEPWSRLEGGKLHDLLDEADINLGKGSERKELPFDEKLRRLEALKTEGLISSQEYEEVRGKILDDLS